VVYAPDPAAAVTAVAQEVRSGDVVLTLGAGDVWKLGEALIAQLGGARVGMRS
jgi:UDP-N-acetylmuramate--alanine ligase